jgi:hypothetical protein
MKNKHKHPYPSQAMAMTTTVIVLIIGQYTWSSTYDWPHLRPRAGDDYAEDFQASTGWFKHFKNMTVLKMKNKR